ncbi:MAG: hypothetical protein OXI43_02720 [Candidatus Poribacteria bacterium]|nr:hypothetical protein [Candidatus Poribacteria bacterium]
MTINIEVGNLSDYLESRLIEEIELTLELLGIENGKIHVVDAPETPQIDKHCLQYNPHPDELGATVFFNDGDDWEEWAGRIDVVGQVECLTDTDGKHYHTQAELKAAGVERVTLEPQHIVWVAD